MINQIERKIELGKQLGINQMVQKGHRDYWYSYAVQKKGNTYYVYEFTTSTIPLAVNYCIRLHQKIFMYKAQNFSVLISSF